MLNTTAVKPNLLKQVEVNV